MEFPEIMFEPFGERRCDVLICNTTNQLLKYFHSGKEREGAIELVVKLTSQVAKFLNIGYYRSGFSTNAWDLLMKTKMFDIKTNEMIIMTETVKRNDKLKLSKNSKIAMTIFTGIQLNIAGIWLIYIVKGARKLETHTENSPIFSYSQVSRVSEALMSLASIKLDMPDYVFEKYQALF